MRFWVPGEGGPRPSPKIYECLESWFGEGKGWDPFGAWGALVHAQTHKNTHTCTHAHTRMRKCTHMRTHAHMHTCTCMHARAHTTVHVTLRDAWQGQVAVQDSLLGLFGPAVPYSGHPSDSAGRGRAIPVLGIQATPQAILGIQATPQAFKRF